MNILDETLEKLKTGKISQRQFIRYCKSDKDIISEIHNQTEFLNQYNADILERLYYIINNVHEVIKCKYCDNKAIWSGRLNEGYKEICNSKKCRTKQLADVHKGKTIISNNRDNDFIIKQSLIEDVNDDVIKDILKYDKFLDLVTNKNILKYLDNRFTDSSSRLETLQRIRFGIEEKPKCPTCGKPVVWVGKKTKMFTTYCCNECRAQNKETHRKMKQTQLENWGNECCYQSEKYKQKMREEYGVDYYWQRSDIKEKRKAGLIEHYGTTKLYQVEEIRNKIISTNREKFGYDSPMQNPEIKQKTYEAIKKSMRFGTSNAEDNVYNWLIELGYNAERFVRSEKFPFNVDFYLKDYDLYIEYQGSQYHHGYSFLGTKDDFIELENLKQKNKKAILESGKAKSQYQSIIDTWSIYDVNKRNYAKNHNIKFLEIYKCNSKEDLQYQLNFYLCCLYNENILNYNKELLQNEYNFYKKLKTENLTNSTGKHHTIIKQFQCNNFFKHEIELFVSDPIIRRKLIQNRVKYLNKEETQLTPEEILTGFKKSGIYYGYSHFNPEWTNWFINKYNIKTIYDPCGGWGHHLLGMISCNKIIYNDFSKSTVDSIQKIKEYFNIDNLEVHYGDGTEYIPEKVDGWFMCPPYYNLEHYECGDFNSLDEYKIFLNKIIKLWQNNSSRVFGIIMREDLIDYIDIKPNEIYDMKIHKTYLNGGKKNLDEKFYIFKK